MGRLVAFICDKCRTFAREEDRRGWITMYAPLNPNSKKNTTFHLCPKCARAAIYQLWDEPETVAQENKKLLDEKLKLEEDSN